MCTGRTHARICLETERDLRELIAQVEDAESRGTVKRWWADQRLTMAEMIAELVRREKAHKARAAAARVKRRTHKRLDRVLREALMPSDAELNSGEYELVADDQVGRQNRQEGVPR